MKRNFLKFIALTLIVAMSCNESEDLLTADAKEGAFVSIVGSSGSLAGSPEAGVDLSDAEITFQETTLTYKIAATSPNADQISELVVYKTFNGQTVEVARESGNSIEVMYDGIDDFLSGFEGVSAEDLRVGDVIGFQVDIVMNDGTVVRNSSAALNVQVSCLSDLTGTYSVTNSGCSNSNFPFTVTITKNPDGSYHLTSADGGFLHRCTANSSLINAGNIIEQCGVILPSGDLEYGPDNSPYDIGIIAGGTWDAATGTLTMEHSQTFTANWASSWTSTYVRQ